MLWETRPALRTAELFQALYGASRRGGGRPSLLAAAAILSEYRDEMRLARPSPLVQRAVFGCLGPIARLVGIR